MVNGQQPPSSFSSSVTDFSTSVPTATGRDLGATFCFSITFAVTLGSSTAVTVPAGIQYVPGTILTFYNPNSYTINVNAATTPIQAYVNSLTTLIPVLPSGPSAQSFVSVLSNATDGTHWVRMYSDLA
jgi:hypothetical protein